MSTDEIVTLKPEYVVIITQRNNEEYPRGEIISPNCKVKQVFERRKNYFFCNEADPFNMDLNPPVEYFVKNSGFTIIVGPPDLETRRDSKNYFDDVDDIAVQCGVIHNPTGIKFTSFISLNYLLSILREVTVINGRVAEDLQFVERNGRGKFVVENSDKARNIQSKVKSASKTKVWEIGRNYKTKEKNQLYLGPVNCWLNEQRIEIQKPGHKLITSKYSIADTPVVKHLTIDIYDYISYCINNSILSKTNSIKELVELIKFAAAQSNTADIINDTYLFNRHSTLYDSTISRLPGEHKLDATNSDQYISDLMKYIRDIRYSEIKQDINTDKYRFEQTLECMCNIRAMNDQKPTFSEEEKQLILKCLDREVTIDFGDGEVHNGLRFKN